MKQSLRSWLWRVSIHQEVDEDIAFHIEMRTRELVDKGLDARIAREMVLADAITHVVTHGTAHRAETGLLLERLGRSPGDLDFAHYVREFERR